MADYIVIPIILLYRESRAGLIGRKRRQTRGQVLQKGVTCPTLYRQMAKKTAVLHEIIVIVAGSNIYTLAKGVRHLFHR